MEADESNKEVSCGGISLRRLTVLDIDAFMVWASDSEVARFCTWEPIQSKEEGIEFISKSVVPHPWFRAICVEDDVAVGAMMVTENKNWGDRCRVELGFHLGSKYWGRGIMTEAVKMGVVEVFKELKEVERVEAFAEVDNVGSQRVLEKAGFTREGVLRKHFRFKARTRDFVLFSLLSTDPPPPAPAASNISLRPLTLSDIDALMVWATDREVTRFCTWEPYQSKEEGINFINNVEWCCRIRGSVPSASMIKAPSEPSRSPRTKAAAIAAVGS